VKAAEAEKVSLEQTLEVQGLSEDKLANPESTILEVAKEFKVPLLCSDFVCNVNRRCSKPVIAIKFNSGLARTSFLHAGKRFNRERKKIEGQKIFVNEALSTIQKKLFYDTKIFARNNDIQFVWFCNGLIHLKKAARSRLIIIRNRSHLEELENGTIDHNQPEVHLVLPEHSRSSNENGQAPSEHQSL
jgi:hypothetical protein